VCVISILQGAPSGLYARLRHAFLVCQGSLPWQPNNVAKRYQRRLIPLAFIALMLENELQYHGLAERSQSANDASISCGNFVKFGPVNSELTVLICERQVRHSQKLEFSSNIS